MPQSGVLDATEILLKMPQIINHEHQLQTDPHQASGNIPQEWFQHPPHPYDLRHKEEPECDDPEGPAEQDGPVEDRLPSDDEGVQRVNDIDLYDF